MKTAGQILYDEAALAYRALRFAEPAPVGSVGAPAERATFLIGKGVTKSEARKQAMIWLDNAVKRACP